MTLKERIHYFETLFDDLISTSSLNEKLRIINNIPREYREDFIFIVECLNGLHKFGYTYDSFVLDYEDVHFPNIKFFTIKEILEYLLEPVRQHNLTDYNVKFHINNTIQYSDFITPIVNRTLKLGIGKSLLEKEDISPMLAKKYDPNKFKLKDKNRVYITQKLDGNRCIAKWNGDRWEFRSRNGKLMHVDFDMSNCPKEYIYDGEVLSVLQTQQSNDLCNRLDVLYTHNTFNTTSGLINKHSTDKNLIYNIFDIIAPSSMYCERREIIDSISKNLYCTNIRILPVLISEEEIDADKLLSELDWFTEHGAEGLMINYGSALYESKRTDSLLKVKKFKTMDMKVIDVCEGAGKYEGLCGALHCITTTEDGKQIDVWIGSGLSDVQRTKWALNADEIIGKIVEIGYFEVSQNEINKGTNKYSMRFPRLLKVRKDKDSTSEF